MHPDILRFGKKFAGLFSGSVLEVGSRNINGSIRSVIPVTLGVDMIDGEGVDLVMNVSELLGRFGPENFDCVVSCDALEHMEDWDSALVNMWGVLKTGGHLLLTMANPNKGLHGYPHDYHRMPLDMMEKVFTGNDLLGSFMSGPSQGVCVVKRGPIDLTIRPRPVQ